MKSRRRSGLLPAHIAHAATQRMVADMGEWAEVYREEVCVAAFRTRIAPAGAGMAGRDRQRVQGKTSPQYEYMAAPPDEDVLAGDEVWVETDRFRVISVTPYEHETQVVMLNLQ